MALALRAPNTIWLGTDDTRNLWDSTTDQSFKVAVAPIIPGSMVQLVNTGDELTWVLAPVGTDQVDFAVAVERPFLNSEPGGTGLAIEEPYAIGDLLAVRWIGVGDTFLARVDNGADVNVADVLSIAVGGFLAVQATTTAAANLIFFKSLIDTGGAVGAATHIRVVRFH